jgi:hypothetical protein
VNWLGILCAFRFWFSSSGWGSDAPFTVGAQEIAGSCSSPHCEHKELLIDLCVLVMTAFELGSLPMRMLVSIFCIHIMSGVRKG